MVNSHFQHSQQNIQHAVAALQLNQENVAFETMSLYDHDKFG